MKVHWRDPERHPISTTACGVHADPLRWYPYGPIPTAEDPAKVTCKHCLRAIEKVARKECPRCRFPTPHHKLSCPE